MTTVTTSRTPTELAKQWHVSPEKIISFIKSGFLRAFDVSSPGSKRPRFRIPLDAIVEFESRRSAMAAPKAVRRKRRKKDDSFVRYF